VSSSTYVCRGQARYLCALRHTSCREGISLPQVAENTSCREHKLQRRHDTHEWVDTGNTPDLGINPNRFQDNIRESAEMAC
jgi:hypothetical protein